MDLVGVGLGRHGLLGLVKAIRQSGGIIHRLGFQEARKHENRKEWREKGEKDLAS